MLLSSCPRQHRAAMSYQLVGTFTLPCIADNAKQEGGNWIRDWPG